jgi:hypothetical protein
MLRRDFGLRGWVLATVGVFLSLAGTVQAQVGLRSGVAQVALVAHSAPHGSILHLGAERQEGLQAGYEMAAVTLRVSANRGYRLVVRATGNAPTGFRLWVRSADGQFQELLAGSPVTVARDRSGSGEWDREIHYRIQAPGPDREAPLPVRYELHIDPII